MSLLYQERNKKDKSLKRLRFLIEILWRFYSFSYVFKWALKLLWLSKTFGYTYEGVQFSEVSAFQPATLPKINSFIDMKQKLERHIHKILPRSFSLFDKCRQLYSYASNWITQLIESILMDSVFYTYENCIMFLPFGDCVRVNDFLLTIKSCSVYHYCTTSFNKAWTQVLRRIKSLTMVPAGNKAKRLSSVNYTIKIIHNHHV